IPIGLVLSDSLTLLLVALGALFAFPLSHALHTPWVSAHINVALSTVRGWVLLVFDIPSACLSACLSWAWGCMLSLLRKGGAKLNWLLSPAGVVSVLCFLASCIYRVVVSLLRTAYRCRRWWAVRLPLVVLPAVIPRRLYQMGRWREAGLALWVGVVWQCVAVGRAVRGRGR
ncbi:hypothetical protein KIPB_007215, partial [Kipferlia bialata]